MPRHNIASYSTKEGFTQKEADKVNFGGSSYKLMGTHIIITSSYDNNPFLNIAY